MANSAGKILTLAAALVFAACAHRTPVTPAAAAADVYPTYGVHNQSSVSPCTSPDCRYVRGPHEPSDPLYPEQWVSTWTMYRVFANYADRLPPYNGPPPPPLREGLDYEVSYGASYYDSTWKGASGEGAMMEYYDKRCLPIFPIDNHFTCAFISLGDVAYFVTYEQDRPAGMPPVCLFSPVNHPPRRDFISHLPYSAGDSRQLGRGAQAYSFWIGADTGRPVQTGVAPDRTDDADIMFGYAFAPGGGEMRPHSFYFSGYPLPPANAPFVSQHYTGFTTAKPDPAETWNLVVGSDRSTLPACHLFDAAPAAAGLHGAEKRAPTWGDIGRWRSQ